jgi:carbon storage regulator CsrA
MLVLSRTPGESIDITLEDGRRIGVLVARVIGNKAMIGISAPKTITVDRHEITERKSRQREPNGNE